MLIGAILLAGCSSDKAKNTESTAKKTINTKVELPTARSDQKNTMSVIPDLRSQPDGYTEIERKRVDVESLEGDYCPGVPRVSTVVEPRAGAYVQYGKGRESFLSSGELASYTVYSFETPEIAEKWLTTAKKIVVTKCKDYVYDLRDGVTYTEKPASIGNVTQADDSFVTTFTYYDIEGNEILSTYSVVATKGRYTFQLENSSAVSLRSQINAIAYKIKD